VGRAYKNAIDAVTIAVASFVLIFTKSEYISVGNVEDSSYGRTRNKIKTSTN